MRSHLAIILICLTSSIAHAQVIPDFTKGDHFRPYLSENEKREQILYPNPPHARTSQELYPELYKNSNENYLAPIKGTPADPANAFKISAQIGMKNSSSNYLNSPIPISAYGSNLSIQQRNQAIHEADMAAYEAQKIRGKQLVDEAVRELDVPTISYDLGRHNNASANRFLTAYSELNKMLNGTQKIDFPKAVWLVESAADNTLSWEEFDGMYQDNLRLISLLMIKDKLSPNDNLAKIMAIYKFMTDTTSVFVANKEKTVVSKPMLYDFEDYEGKTDPSKVFVSKLLRTGTGQCMSLPMLYFLFAKSLGAEANIAFAPQHTFITFKDHRGVRQNIELTGRVFSTTDFYWQSGFIKSEQVKSGIYLNPLSDRETLSYLMTTLALTYIKTQGIDDNVLQMATTAKEHFPNCLTANMILAGYGMELWKNVIRQYETFGLTETRLNKDSKAQEIRRRKENSVDFIRKQLGWSDMPDWAYKKWLDGVNALAMKQEHIVRRRQLEHQLNR